MLSTLTHLQLSLLVESCVLAGTAIVGLYTVITKRLPLRGGGAIAGSPAQIIGIVLVSIGIIGLLRGISLLIAP